MQVLVDDCNIITAFATVGGFDGGIEVDDSIVPQEFVSYFKPRRYLYNEGKIELNSDFEEDTEITLPSIKPTIVAPGTDEELRVMFATMQVQLVQANTMVMQLSQQNANLSQEVVSIKQKLEEVTNNEDVVSEV